jgi:transcriptional regulator of acetoin/glycerol metabolism
MERVLILDDSGCVETEDLPDNIRFGHQQRGSLVIDSPSMTLEELEREYILKVLQHTSGQKKRASELLGINASTLYRKLIAYGLERRGGPLGPGEMDEHAA